MKNHRYPYPIIPVSGEVLDGSNANFVQYKDLKKLAGSKSVGIFDAETYHIATASGKGKKFFIGHSSEHTRDFLDKFIFGAKNPKGAHYWEFKGDDVISFEYSDPQGVKDEVWALGYTGSDACDLTTPTFECDQQYGIEVEIYGDAAKKYFGGTKVEHIYADGICCSDDECTTGCLNSKVDCELVMKSLAKNFNKNVILSGYGLHARFVSNTYAPSTANMIKYRLSVIDDGSDSALAAVQSTLPVHVEVKRVTRIGATSLYEICSDTAPADFAQPQQFILPTDCATCDLCGVTGVTTIPAQKVYTVIRPISETTDLSSPAAQTAFAEAVEADYAGAVSSVFLSFNPAAAVVEVYFAASATDPVAVLADTVVFSRTTSVQCQLPAAASIPWTQCGVAYRETRTLCITLKRKDCGEDESSAESAGEVNDRLAELQAYYADDKRVVAGSVVKIAGVDCADSYQLQQWSKGCLEDGCLAKDVATFEPFEGYDGQPWTEVEPTPIVYNEAKRCGLEIRAKIDEEFISDCEYDLGDQLVRSPVQFRVSWIINKGDGQIAYCDNKGIPTSTKLQASQVPTQTGASILYAYLKYSQAYDVFASDYCDTKMRRVLDSQLRKQVEKDTPYRLYYLQTKIERGNRNFDEKSEVVEIIFPVPMTRPDKMAKLEKAILSPLSKFGVVLTERK